MGTVVEEGMWLSSTIKGRNGGGHTSKPNTGNGSDGPVPEEIPSSQGPVERGSAGFTTPYPQPSQAPHFLSNSLPMWSGTTALSLYQPLEVHDPFFISPSSWLVPAVLSVLVFAFLGIVTKKFWYSFGKSRATQPGNGSDIDALVFNSLLLEDSLAMPALTPSPQTLSFSTITSVQTSPLVSAPPPPLPPQMLSLSTIISVETSPSLPAPPPSPPALSLAPTISVYSAPSTPVLPGRSTFTPVHSSPSAPPAPAPSMTLYRNPVESVQGSGEESGEVKESTDPVKVDIAASKRKGDGDICRNKPEESDANENGNTKADATVWEEKREDRNNGSKEKGSEAGEGDGKEDWEGFENDTHDGSLIVDVDVDGSKKKGSEAGEGDGKEDWGEVENDSHDGSLVVEVEKKKKKHRRRQNAKKRAEKRAAAEQASKEAEEAPNASTEDTNVCEGKQETAHEVELEASDPPETGLEATQRAKARGKKTTLEMISIMNLTTLAEDSQGGIMTKKTEKDIEDEEEEKNPWANDVDTQAKQMPLDDGQGEDLVAIGEGVQMRKKRRRRRKQRVSPTNDMSDSGQHEEAPA